MMAPAPRKPMPVTICAAIRVGSARTTDCPEARNAWKPYAPTMVKSADPSATSRWVRRPASRSRSSRSTPIKPPSAGGSASRSSDSSQFSVGRVLDASCSNGFFLRGGELADPARRELEQVVQPRTAERRPLGSRLHFDEGALAGHHDVHVDLRLRILGVVQIDQPFPVDDPHRHGSNGPRQRAREPEAVEGAPRRDVGAGDRRAARAAVCLEDVAVHPQRPLAERLEVGDGTNRASDQPLDLDRPAALLAARRLPIGALSGRRREQRVLGCEPAATLPVEPARHTFLDRGGAEHLRLALAEEDRAVRLLEVIREELERTKLVRAAAVGAAQAAASAASSTRSTSAIGNCRNRAPISRNASGSPVVRKRYDPSRSGSFSYPLRASVCATSRAVSSAEKTSVTSRPNTRWKIGRING